MAVSATDDRRALIIRVPVEIHGWSRRLELRDLGFPLVDSSEGVCRSLPMNVATMPQIDHLLLSVLELGRRLRILALKLLVLRL
jgi:hypothetical protein